MNWSLHEVSLCVYFQLSTLDFNSFTADNKEKRWENVQLTYVNESEGIF